MSGVLALIFPMAADGNKGTDVDAAVAPVSDYVRKYAVGADTAVGAEMLGVMFDAAIGDLRSGDGSVHWTLGWLKVVAAQAITELALAERRR